jgi:hypothetical protein
MSTTVESLGLVRSRCERCRQVALTSAGEGLCSDCHGAHLRRPAKKRPRMDLTSHIGAWPKRKPKVG